MKTTKGLYVTVEALPGKEAEVEAFLKGAQSIVDDESETTAWFAIRIGPSTFGVFDAFPSDAGRQTHLNGGVGQALMASVGELIEAPSITEVDVLAEKLP